MAIEFAPSRAETAQPRDNFRLDGHRFVVDISGFKSQREVTSSGSCEDDMFESTDTYTDLNGTGMIVAKDGSIIQKFNMKQSKTGNPYDDRKVDFLSQVFERPQVRVSNEDYADVVAEHLLSSFQSADSSGVYDFGFGQSNEPAAFNSTTGYAAINLEKYPATLTRYLVDRGVLPEPDGQFRLSY